MCSGMRNMEQRRQSRPMMVRCQNPAGTAPIGIKSRKWLFSNWFEEAASIGDPRKACTVTLGLGYISAARGLPKWTA